MTGAPFPPHLRLVPAPQPPRPRRHEARIVVSTARLPIGRSRGFHLSELDISRLVAIAEHLEAQGHDGSAATAIGAALDALAEAP